MNELAWEIRVEAKINNIENLIKNDQDEENRIMIILNVYSRIVQFF